MKVYFPQFIRISITLIYQLHWRYNVTLWSDFWCI